MTPEQFCYWLQGRAELMPDTPPSAAEWKMIGEHLATVFKKVTPLQPSKEYKEAMDKLSKAWKEGPGPVVYQPAPPTSTQWLQPPAPQFIC